MILNSGEDKRRRLKGYNMSDLSSLFGSATAAQTEQGGFYVYEEIGEKRFTLSIHGRSRIYKPLDIRERVQWIEQPVGLSSRQVGRKISSKLRQTTAELYSANNELTDDLLDPYNC